MGGQPHHAHHAALFYKAHGDVAKRFGRCVDRSFGWITCGGKGSDKSSLLKKFKLTEDDVYINDEGDTTIIMGGFLTLTVLFDNNELVKTIEFNTGP